MASISDLLLQTVRSTAGKVNVPSNLSNQVLGGLSDSILGGLTQTASTPGGLNAIKDLFGGKADAATSPVTQAAGNLFQNNILSKFNLGAAGASLTALIPTILTKFSGLIKDRDGDGDVDINDVLLALKGGNAGGSGLLGTVTGILGGLFGKN